MTAQIPLKEVLQELRKELLGTMKASEDEPLRFRIEELEVEFQVVVTKAAEANIGGEGGAKLMVLNALAKGGAGVSYENNQVQRLRLKLAPRTDGGDIPNLAG